MNKETSEIQYFGFENNERAKAIPLSLLRESIRVEDNLGREFRSRPIQAWTLLLLIAEMLKAAEINFKVNPIMVRDDSSGLALNDEDKAAKQYNKQNCPINKWYFDQLITSIDIPNIGTDLANGTIAISYVKRGINIALGLNVRVCSNLAILGGQQMRTYKFGDDQGFSWDKMRNNLGQWVETLDQRLRVESQIMNRMIEREISNEIAVDQIIGKLYQKAVSWRYFGGDQAPFDISGMSTFVQEVIRRRAKEERLDNVWDLYNWGTAIMKPQYERLENIAEASRIFSDFLCEEFAVEREDLVSEIQIVED